MRQTLDIAKVMAKEGKGLQNLNQGLMIGAPRAEQLSKPKGSRNVNLNEAERGLALDLCSEIRLKGPEGTNRR